MSWAAVFPGQGAQHPGMGHFLYDNFKEAKVRFEEASDTLSLDFKKLCFFGSEEDLQLTQNTQPALLLASTAAYDVAYQLTGFRMTACAGHSIGEYAALVAAGALPFTKAIKAVRIRGEAMQSAVPVGEGGMCAVMGMTESQVREMCTWAETQSGLKPLEPANFNSPGQIVISGNNKAIEWLIANFKKEVLSEPPTRAKFIPLKVSAPFHCSLMKPAEETMRRVLTEIEFYDTATPVVQNFNAEPEKLAAQLRENLIRQVSSPVLWTKCVEKLKVLGATKTLELGSGKVLSGLIKKIDSETFQTFNFTSLEEVQLFTKAFNEAN